MGKLRTLIHSKLYDSQCESLDEQYDIEDAVNGTTYYIAWKPQDFIDIGGGYYVAKTEKSGRTPAMRILYLVEDDDHIQLCAISLDNEREFFDAF